MIPSDPSEILPRLPSGAEVLIIRLRSLGDVVMLTPALAALHAWRPDLRLCVVVERAWSPLLEGNPAVAEILVAGDFFSTARMLRRRRFPVTFNQHTGPRSALLTAVAGSPARICWKGRQFSFLYNVLAPDAEEFYGHLHVHTVEQRMTQFYFAGLPRGPIPPARAYPQPEGMALARSLLAKNGLKDGEPYAILQPGARYFTKRWAVENFGAVARWLHEERGLRPVYLLGPDESQMTTAVRREAGATGIVLTSPDLRTFIALLAGARLFVGNDSGPAHAAAATGRPCVVIFGSSSSVWWRPWQGEHRAVQNDFPCNPCRGDRCYAFDEPRCILSVTPNQVKQAIAELLPLH